MKLPKPVQRDILARAARANGGDSPPKRARKPRTPGPLPLPPEGSSLLGLDPSGECCGWALVGDGGAPTDWGVIRPTSREVTVGDRARFISNVVTALCARYRPGLAVVEMCSGLVYRHERRHSLAPLAFVQGAVFRAVEQAGIRAVEITERQWCGSQPKRDRATVLHAIHAEFGRWAKSSDPGLDATDALGLALWYQRQISVTH